LFDLFPTICDLAGVATPSVVEGKSLLGIIEGRQTNVRDKLFGAYKDGQRMVRDARWKLIQYNAGGVRNAQLFDLKMDPDELHNLADDPAFAAQRLRLEKMLSEAREEFDDPVDFEAARKAGASSARSTPRVAGR
jgi:arylsulfatase A-like enzyme